MYLIFEFYIHKNNQFRLPAEDKDVIMIGPGTGVAPFRSFLAQRDATGASGRNWLFFGDQHFVTDFLYQTEWQSWLGTGSLTKMNVAFSCSYGFNGYQNLFRTACIQYKACVIFAYFNFIRKVYSNTDC